LIRGNGNVMLRPQRFLWLSEGAIGLGDKERRGERSFLYNQERS